MKKLLKIFKSSFAKIFSLIDKGIIIPTTKFIVSMTDKYGNSGKKIESWLSRANTILYISLLLAVVTFIIVDQKIITFSESSAEILKSQPVNAIYNEEAYVIEGLPSTVDITLIGSKADLYFAKQSPSHDINVDLSALKPGTHRVNIGYNQALPSVDYKVNPSVATVIIHPKVSISKTLTVDLLNKDSLDDKLVIKDVNIANDKVVIKGSEDQLKKVASVKALVDVLNLVKQEVGTTTLKDIPLRAYDENGSVVDIEIVPSKITADIVIASPSKDLPIKIIPKGSVSFGKAISSIISNVTSLTVYGDEDALADLKFVPVEIDVTNLKENQQYKMELVKPVGVTSMSVNNITVNVSLEAAIDKEITGIPIEYRNLGENYTVQALSKDDLQVSVILKGVASVVNSITSADVIAYLDLKGYAEGTHEVDVLIEQSDVKIEYVPKTKKVSIRIYRK